jgi:outer membrane lipoprotein carrier protein
MKNRCAVLVALIFVWPLAGGTHVNAQMRAFDCPSDSQMKPEDGKRLLDSVQKNYAGIDVLNGSFRQDSYVAALDEGEVSSGEMWFGKPGKMRWVYREPRDQIVVINEETLWMYQQDKNQVLIDDITQVLLSNLPVLFMTGVGNLSRDFDFKGACRGTDGVVLTLQPRTSAPANGQDPLEGFQLLVDEHQNLPKGAKITSLGGNITAIIFEGLRTKGFKVSPDIFVLDYPKGVDVIDRRVARTK